jgi:hypothetical protein
MFVKFDFQIELNKPSRCVTVMYGELFHLQKKHYKIKCNAFHTSGRVHHMRATNACIFPHDMILHFHAKSGGSFHTIFTQCNLSPLLSTP